jgi:multidrug efflux pump subunit AcrA (membrane-fusion protein)
LTNATWTGLAGAKSGSLLKAAGSKVHLFNNNLEMEPTTKSALPGEQQMELAAKRNVMKPKRHLVLAIAVSAAIAVLAGCGGETPHDGGERPAKAPVPVRTVAIAQEEVARSIDGTGTVEARTEALLAARVMGYIERLHVREGDRVRAGQVLAEISASEIQSSVEQAKASGMEARSALAEVESAIRAAESQRSLAETTLNRMRNLHERKSISDQEFDEVKARYAAAEAQVEMAKAKQAQVNERIAQAAAGLRQAEAQASYLKITAPFDGLVTDRMAEPGNLATPGAPLLRVEQSGAYRLVASFPETVMGNLKVGQKLPVQIEALDLQTGGTVAELAPVVDPATRTIAVKIALPAHSAIRSGLFGRAQAPAGTQTMLRVPETAVHGTGQLRSVFVVEEKVARSRMVKLGETRDGMREVLSGLQSGDRIVVDPPSELRDGAPVEVTQ